MAAPAAKDTREPPQLALEVDPPQKEPQKDPEAGGEKPNDQLEIKLHEKTKLNTKLKKTAKEWKAKAQQAIGELQTANDNRLEVERRLADTRADVERLVHDKEEVVRHFRQQVRTTEEELSASLQRERAQFSVLEEECQQLKMQVEELAADRRRLEAIHQQLQTANGALREELGVSTQKVDELNKALIAKHEEVNNAFLYGQQHLEAAQAESTELRKTLDRAAEEGEDIVAELRRQLSEALRTADRDTSGERLAELTWQLDAASLEQERLREELQASAADNEAMVTQLRAELERQREELERAQESMGQGQKQVRPRAPASGCHHNEPGDQDWFYPSGRYPSCPGLQLVFIDLLLFFLSGFLFQEISVDLSAMDEGQHLIPYGSLCK